MKKMKRISIFVFFIFLAIGISFLLWNGIFLLLDNRQILEKSLSSAITAQQESFTELYFENNENLPIKITNNQQFILQHPTLALFTFQFTIHNKENKDMTYPYEVFTLIDGEKTILDTGIIGLKNNTKKTTSESFSAPKIFPNTEVIVNLPSKKQQISFWMEIKQ